MRRLARRSAGRQVLARAERLSNETLAYEERALALLALEFADREAPARKAVEQALQHGVGGLQHDRMLRQRLVRLMGEAFDAVEPVLAGLLDQVGHMAAEAIREELAVCEETIAARYHGAAESAVARVEASLPDRIDDALTSYRGDRSTRLNDWWALADQQVRFAALYDETGEQVLARLFSRTPLRMKGNGGRGIWYRPLPGVQATVRGAAVQLVNDVRVSSMEQTNAEWKRRG